MSHHATEDLAIMRSLPDVAVLSPGDDWEAAEATEAVAHRPGVCYLRLDRSSAGSTRRGTEAFAIGKMRQLRQGRAITLLATGGILADVLSAADIMEERGVRCRVISVHTVKPLDDATLVQAARETGGIVTIEEHTIHGGLGSAVAEVLMDSGVQPRRFCRIGLRDGLSGLVGSQAYLRRQHTIDCESIVQRVQQLLNRPAAATVSRWRAA
jgi:transketolase